LRTCLWAARKSLGGARHRIIASDGEDIVLDQGAFDVDALTLRRLAAEGGRAELEAAANLYGGELLAGLDVESEAFESWRRSEDTRYRDQIADVLLRMTARLAEDGETERAIETASRLLHLDPLHETAARQLMRLYVESGRRASALQIYRELSARLRDELGVEPEAETRRAYAEAERGSAAAPSESPAPREKQAASIEELPSRTPETPTAKRWRP
jgi:DNA-binding SARP family transcriptional activator